MPVVTKADCSQHSETNRGAWARGSETESSVLIDDGEKGIHTKTPSRDKLLRLHDCGHGVSDCGGDDGHRSLSE
eukprot:g5762.t1